MTFLIKQRRHQFLFNWLSYLKLVPLPGMLLVNIQNWVQYMKRNKGLSLTKVKKILTLICFMCLVTKSVM